MDKEKEAYRKALRKIVRLIDNKIADDVDGAELDSDMVRSHIFTLQTIAGQALGIKHFLVNELTGERQTKL